MGIDCAPLRIGRVDRHYKLTEKLIAQGFWYSRLCVAFKKFLRSRASIFKCSVRKYIEIRLAAIDVTTCRC